MNSAADGAGGDAIHMDEFFTTCPWIMPESLVKGIFVNERGQLRPANEIERAELIPTATV